jgi:hypothetical protein
MNTKVERIKVWTKNWNGRDGYDTETRVYIDMSDGRRGGLFVTGNPYQDAGDIDGQLTAEDIAEAEAVCGGEWRTMYEEDVNREYQLQEIRESEAEAEETKEEVEPESEVEQESESENDVIRCDRCGKQVDHISELTIYGSEDICQKCLDIETGREQPGHRSLSKVLFGKQEHAKKCTDCGTKKNLNAVATRSDHSIIWRCDDCKSARKREQHERAARARDRVQHEAIRDHWEEGV